MKTRERDLQAVLEKARAFEKNYALSQYPGGWASEDVGLIQAK